MFGSKTWDNVRDHHKGLPDPTNQIELRRQSSAIGKPVKGSVGGIEP
jgi:hypothetical protein